MAKNAEGLQRLSNGMYAVWEVIQYEYAIGYMGSDDHGIEKIKKVFKDPRKAAEYCAAHFREVDELRMMMYKPEWLDKATFAD